MDYWEFRYIVIILSPYNTLIGRYTATINNPLSRARRRIHLVRRLTWYPQSTYFQRSLDMNEDSEKKPSLRKPYTGAGIGVGAAVGLALGMVFDQLALGVALGTAFGAAMDVVAHVRYKNSK
jgi:ElaB/YqjD/DUF883 family membrane-anchored ribosome-binding protein